MRLSPRVAGVAAWENSIYISFIPLGSSGDIVLTQTPLSLSVIPGETTSISCKSSQSLVHSDGKTYLNSIQHKPGQSPQGLIYQVSNHYPGVPDRFTGSGSGTFYTISSVQAEDAGIYYCYQGTEDPPTFSCHAPLAMGFSRQECWSGLLSPPPEDLPDPGIELPPPASPALAGWFFTTSTI
ncbi:hypothetical protein FD754_023326 [Muntiacus muntjak]|uniref:Ig-like domain-containing protein n=1 Tax=Muntiacus muntjak TaxID=9888 RepID=A0A5N3UTT0_MUNMU|nr:hypothetical protein FD754_023327 [Muntiacus muntjak]KAB0340205.1 hypothetical protein FD754_023326 [Muntiacus muntjak]